MSHFSRIRTQLVDKAYLRQALEDLGYAVEEGAVDVRGYGGNRARVELKVATRSPGYDLGFHRAGDAYELVADWWGIHDIDRDHFLSQLTQRYAYRAALARLGERGFTLVSEQGGPGEPMHLLLRRVV